MYTSVGKRVTSNPSVCLLFVCISIDLQINNVTTVMQLKEQLVGKKLSEQILK